MNSTNYRSWFSRKMAKSEDTEGWTNLHHAVAGKFTKLVQSLLEAKGEEIVNTQDGQGRTPLHLACIGIVEKDIPLFLKLSSENVTYGTMTEAQQIIESLLSFGADAQILDIHGKSPLHYLVDCWLAKQYPVEEAAKIITLFLYSKGCIINVRDNNGRTLLHYVAGSPELKVPVVKVKDVEVPIRVRGRREILGGEARNEAENTTDKESLPMYSPEQALFLTEFIGKLLSFGADVNIADKEGNTPLHLAITAGKFEVVKELLKGKSNINIKNSEGQTPLHHAVSDHAKFNNCAILLMHKGALASIEDVRGKTPVDICRGRPGFSCFLKHLILLINVKMHPEIDISMIQTGCRDEVIQDCMQECKNLNSYFELQGKSQLPIFLQYHSFPSYTENDFFQSKINCKHFTKRFPNYSHFLIYKFLQDKGRREMIEQCTKVFSCFGGSFHYTSAGRLFYTKNSHWEMMPGELKLKILSYLSDSDLEYLKKQLVVEGCSMITLN